MLFSCTGLFSERIYIDDHNYGEFTSNVLSDGTIEAKGTLTLMGYTLTQVTMKRKGSKVFITGYMNIGIRSEKLEGYLTPDLNWSLKYTGSIALANDVYMNGTVILASTGCSAIGKIEVLGKSMEIGFDIDASNGFISSTTQVWGSADSGWITFADFADHRLQASARFKISANNFSVWAEMHYQRIRWFAGEYTVEADDKYTLSINNNCITSNGISLCI